MSNRLKRITFVCQYLAKGGAERVLSVLINYLSEHGYQIRVILLYKKEIAYKINSDVEILQLNWTRERNAFKRIKREIKLGELFEENEVIISFLYSAIRATVFASMFKNVKLIFSERNDPANDPNGYFRRLFRTLLYYKADLIVFQTEDARAYFPRKIQDKGVIICNPIEDDIVDRRETIEKVVSVCRLSKQKNIYMAIDAFEHFWLKYPSFIYEIYGEGELLNEIEDYIRHKGLENAIFLKGFSTQIHEKMRDAYMYISSSDYEGISNSMLEAMAMGLPVICTDCPIGGARLVIDNSVNGILVPVNDSNALYNAMIEVVENKELRSTIEKNARNVRNIYNKNEICHLWEEEILKVR